MSVGCFKIAFVFLIYLLVGEQRPQAMGVRGLATYIDKNRDVLNDVDFREGPLVIDGNNLYYALHNSIKTRPSNGDYPAFARAVQKFFRHLGECDITAYVVFDGAYEPDDRKLKTVMERSREKLHQASLISKGIVGLKVMPILAFDSFLSILKQLGVSYCMADFEADEALVSLANALSAPVLSNDSDFFIYDLDRGFLRFDYFDYVHVRTNERGQKFLRVKMFDATSFCSHHPGLKKELLPLFATLVGNDFVDSASFENFFRHIHQPKFKRGKSGVRGNKRHCKMKGLLEWMSGLMDLDEGLGQILPHIKKEQRARVKGLIAKGLTGYRGSADDLSDFFGDEPNVGRCNLTNASGRSFPTDLWNSVRAAEWPPQTLNVFVNGRSFLPFQVENMEESPACELSRALRELVYSLMCSLCDDDCVSESFCGIEEVSRRGRQLLRSMVEVPINGGILSAEASVAERRDFILSRCDLDDSARCFIERCAPYFSLFYISVIYAFQRSLFLSGLDLLAFLACHAYCLTTMYRSYPSYRRLISGDERDNNADREGKTGGQGNVAHLVSAASAETLTAIIDRISCYGSSKCRDRLSKTFLHGTAQWQACFLTLIHLNRILRAPFPVPDPALLYDGEMIFTLQADLKGRKNPRSFVADELFRGSQIGTWVVDAFENLSPICGTNTNDTSYSREDGRRVSTKKARTKTSVIPQDTEEVEDYEETDEETWLDKNNIFSLLSI